MLRKQFQKLFARTFWSATAFGVAALTAYQFYSSGYYDFSMVTELAMWDKFAVRYWLIFFLIPIVVTYLITGRIWEKTEHEPLTEEERQQNFITKLSKTQLFIPLLLLSCVVLYILATGGYIETYRWAFYLYVAVQYGVVWCLTLLLHRTARVHKVGWKITLIVIGLIWTGLYVAATFWATPKIADLNLKNEYAQYVRNNVANTTITIPSAPKKKSIDLDELLDGMEPMEEIPEYPFQDQFANSPSQLADTVADWILNVYEYQNRNDAEVFWRLQSYINGITKYDSEATPQYSNYYTFSRDKTRPELEQEITEIRQDFKKTQQLGQFYKWACQSADYADLDQLSELIVQNLDDAYPRFVIRAYSKLINLLQQAFDDLWQQGIEKYGRENAELIFRDVYDKAVSYQNEGDWRENLDYFSDFIDIRYVTYLEKRDLFYNNDIIWAYTFWGRRYNDISIAKAYPLFQIFANKCPREEVGQKSFVEQRASMQGGEARMEEFIEWYKAMYPEILQLKVAQYGNGSSPQKIDPEAYKKYIELLKENDYFTPQLIENLETLYSDKDPIAAVDRDGTQRWLIADPLLGISSDQIATLDNITCKTTSIEEPQEKMHIGVSCGGYKFTFRVVTFEPEGRYTWYIDDIVIDAE